MANTFFQIAGHVCAELPKCASKILISLEIGLNHNVEDTKILLAVVLD